jgi:hypothetical protein
MYDKFQAKRLVEKAYPGAKAKDCFVYKGLFLVRVEHPDPDEANYDPFLSVDPVTGEVNEFSVLTDGDPVAIAEAFNNR